MSLLNQRITELTENTSPAPDDYVPHVDRSDTSMAISGTTKYWQLATIWKAFQTWVFAEDAGANDTYTATLAPAPDAYIDGVHYRFKANTANTGACTINFNGLGAKAIKKAAGGITTDLADNDILAGQWVDLVYDGDNDTFQMQSTLGNAASPESHASDHEDGGGDELDVTGLLGVLADPQIAGAILETGDPQLLTVGAVADGQFLKRAGTDIVGAAPGGGSGLGDVVGPGSSTDNAVARFDSTTGKIIQNSNLTLPDDAASTEVGYMNIPQNSQSAAYTTVIADRGKHVYHPTSDDNPRTFTIDSNANVAYPIGTAITFINDQNTVTIAITDDTLVWAEDGSTGSRTLAENGIATAIKVASTRWIISGVGLS